MKLKIVFHRTRAFHSLAWLWERMETGWVPQVLGWHGRGALPLLPVRPGRAQVGAVLISLSQNCLPGEGVLDKLREASGVEGSWLWSLLGTRDNRRGSTYIRRPGSVIRESELGLNIWASLLPGTWGRGQQVCGRAHHSGRTRLLASFGGRQGRDSVRPTALQETRGSHMDKAGPWEAVREQNTSPSSPEVSRTHREGTKTAIS